MKLLWPAGTGRQAIVAGAAVWTGAVVAFHPHVIAVLASLSVVCWLLLGRRWSVVVLGLAAFVAGSVAFQAAGEPLPDLMNASSATHGVIATDPSPLRDGIGFVLRSSAVRVGNEWHAVEERLLGVFIHPDQVQPGTVGDSVTVRGRIAARKSRLHRSTVAGWITARGMRVDRSDAIDLLTAGNWVRSRVQTAFPSSDSPAGLVKGFLIGDTRAVAAVDLENMRRAGLLHFVAVSGGNVAIFVGGWWLMLAPLRLRPRTRAVAGLVGVMVFAMATRWEPSVVRASVMVALILLGRVGGFPLDTWTALGSTIVLSLLVAPELALDVGFQLSVAATAGLLLGARSFAGRRPRIVWAAWGATLSAQLAVAPLLLFHFGSFPLGGFVANVFAAPLVVVGTVSGWAAVVVAFAPVRELAQWAAVQVLSLARLGAVLPTVGWVGLVGVGLGWFIMRRHLRVLAFLALVGSIPSLSPPIWPAVPSVVFLSVGQGDATLLLNPDGAVVGIDVGPDPVVYRDALRRHGVARIDLLILTHGDGDHVGGLEGLASVIDIGEVWLPKHNDWGPAVETNLGRDIASVTAVAGGSTAAVGAFRISVLSPNRRYAERNDGSIVVWVEVDGQTILLPGDIEAVAQNELPPVRPDIMAVPHHGSATTDTDWLRETLGRYAVISYGQNTFGHPSPAVLAILNVRGISPFETIYGDVRFDFFPDMRVTGSQ